jgi:hypothetical protein
MAIVNVIPQVSSYAVAVPGAAGQPATVQVLDADGDKLLRTVTPFPGFEGTPSVAMADVNGDMVLDLVAGTGAGAAPQVVAYDGATASPFAAELTRFAPFADDVRGGVSVAGADVDGNALADNIIVGTGPGTPTQVKVFSTTLSTTGQAPAAFSTFTPYADSTAGVTLATGLVDATSGRQTIVTAPGPGVPAQIKTWRFDLFTPTAAAARATTIGSSAPGTTDVHAAHDPTVPTLTADFAAFDPRYLGGASLSTGWVAGAEGGAKSIVTGMLGGDGTVRVWSSGSQLEGSPPIYLQSPDHHAGPITFNQIASFAPFADAPSGSGVRVATTTPRRGRPDRQRHGPIRHHRGAPVRPRPPKPDGHHREPHTVEVSAGPHRLGRLPSLGR